MLEFKWKVTSVTTKDLTQPLTATFATFTVVATDTETGATSTEGGAVDLLPPVEGGSFAEFNELAQDDFVRFVKEALAVPGKDSAATYEARLTRQLQVVAAAEAQVRATNEKTHNLDEPETPEGE